MKKLVLVALMALGAMAVFRNLPEGRRTRVKERFDAVMEHCPPVAMMAEMTRFQEQNSEMITLLREQNDLLRRSLAARREATAAPASAP